MRFVGPLVCCLVISVMPTYVNGEEAPVSEIAPASCEEQAIALGIEFAEEIESYIADCELAKATTVQLDEPDVESLISAEE